MAKNRSLSAILFKSREAAKPSCHDNSSSLSHPSSSSSRPWHSCKHPMTMTESFREPAMGDAVCKTANSAFIFDCNESSFTHSSEEERQRQGGGSFSTTLSEDSDGDALLQEVLLRGLRSDRLFFEPRVGTTSSILPDEALEESAVALTLDSDDPYWDFRSSMEEMVAARGRRLRDWEGLEELLQWYLRANAVKTHGFILAAFLDLLLSLVYSFVPPPPSSSDTCLELKVKEKKEVASDKLTSF